MSMSMPSNAPTMPQRQNTSTTYPGRQFFTPPSTLPGYYIEGDKDIVPQYIPMDGSISFFPYKDLSKIVIKQWDANGLNTLEYVIAPPPPMSTSQDAQQSSNEQSAVAVAPAPPPSQIDLVVETLQNLNTAMANTFNQFSATLQGMQGEISAIANEIGGRG